MIHATIEGNITRDANFSTYTSNGKEEQCAFVTVASNDGPKDDQKTAYVDIAFFGDGKVNAFKDRLVKGAHLVAICDGTKQDEKYDDKDGVPTRKVGVKFVCRRVLSLTAKSNGEAEVSDASEE